MKQKIKEFSKKYLVGFIIGSILFGTLGVYAVTYFPGLNTTYDNSDSGMTSTNVQDALDELYNVCVPPKAGDQIIEEGNLTKDEYECRYFFTGGHPNNFIILNKELWRIISVECDGRIKITGGVNTTNYEWDTSNSNNWNRPSSLNTGLNGTYYADLNSAVGNKIVASKFSIGAVTRGNNDLAEQIKDENSKTWNGNIALPTVSEYIRTNSNKDSCGTFSLINKNSTNCISTGWMHYHSSYWLLSPSSNSTTDVFSVMSSYAIGADAAGSTINSISPTFYLSSEVKITGGTGTSSDPYTIE